MKKITAYIGAALSGVVMAALAATMAFSQQNATGVTGQNVGGFANIVFASFTRPANTTAYAANQFVGPSTTAASNTALTLNVARYPGGTGSIRRVRITKSSTSIANAAFELYLYRPTNANVCPTPAAGDGGTYSTDSAEWFIGKLPVTMTETFTDGAKGLGVPSIGTEITFDTPANVSRLCGFLKATAAYTPVSGETFRVALETFQN